MKDFQESLSPSLRKMVDQNLQRETYKQSSISKAIKMLELKIQREDWLSENKMDVDAKLPRDIYEQIRVKATKNWNNMLE